MSLNILGFLKNILPSFSKSEIESDLEISLEYIPVIEESYTGLEQILKVSKITSNNSKNVIHNIYKELDKFKHIRLTNNKNIATDTLTLFKNIKINGDYILKNIDESLSQVISTSAISLKKTILLRAASHYYYLTKYALDLINYIYEEEASNAGFEFNKTYKLNKKQIEFIEKNAWIYARLLCIYGDTNDKFVHKLKNIEDITITDVNEDEITSIYSSDKLDITNILPQNFLGSPIYSIRLVLATWQADRYRRLKDKKKLLELRYAHLKLLKDNGSTDINIEKEIEILQKRITDLDYSISKIEKSIE